MVSNNPIHSPEELFNTFINKNKDRVVLFIAIFMTGLLTHLYIMTNKLFNYFELGNIFAGMSYWQGDTVAQGRWSIPFITNAVTTYSSPVINGVISVICFSLISMLVIDTLDIKGFLYSYLAGAAFMTYPGYACIMSYGVNSDLFSIVAFMCVLGAWLYIKGVKFGAFWAIVLIGTGLGGYQTYFSLSIGLVFIWLFFDIYYAKENIDIKAFIIKMVKAGLVLAAAFVFYYAVLKLSCAITGVSLSDYHGVDSMTSFTLKGIIKGLVYSYGYFISYFFTTNYIYTYVRIAFNLLGALAFLIFAIRKIKQFFEKGLKLNGILLMLFTALVPLGVNATPFLMADRVGAGVDRYMIPSLMLLWAMLMKLAQASCEKETYLLKYAALISCLWAMVTSGVICNEAYHRLDAATVTTEAYLNRIAARLELTQEYVNGQKVFFANAWSIPGNTYQVELPYFEALKNMPGTDLFPFYNEDAIEGYFETYLRMPVNAPGEDEKQRILENPVFKKMPAFPSTEAIKIIDDIIVIKLCEDKEGER